MKEFLWPLFHYVLTERAFRQLHSWIVPRRRPQVSHALHLSHSQLVYPKMTFVDDVADSLDKVLSTISFYSESHKDGIIALFLLFGVIITFTGKALIRPTVFLLGFLPTSTIMTSFGVALVADMTKSDSSPPVYVPFVQVAIVLTSLILGILVGIVMVRLLFRVTIFLICGVSGAVMVATIYLLLMQPSNSRNALSVWYACMLLAAIVAALLSVTYPSAAIILGTSFDGAALAVISVSRFLGHRPVVFNPLLPTPSPTAPSPSPSLPPSSKSIDNWWAMSYAIAVLILAIFGAVTQYRVAVADRIVAQHSQEKRRRSRPQETSIMEPGPPVLLQLPSNTEVEDEYASTVANGSPSEKRSHKFPTHFLNPSRFLLPPSQDQERVTVIEPSTPTSHSGNNSMYSAPQSSLAVYGSTDQQDAQYSVIHNLGAQPLNHST